MGARFRRLARFFCKKLGAIFRHQIKTRRRPYQGEDRTGGGIVRIGSVMRDWRWENKLDIRQGAALIGISPATLSRIENGKACDSRTFSKLLTWLFCEDVSSKVEDGDE